MKKGRRVLAMLSATVLLVGGCGTPMYEMTEEEETLVVQYAAHVVGKYNIRQKDGMTNAKPKEEDTQKSEQKSTEQKPDSQEQHSSGNSGTAESDASQYAEISLAGAVGYDSVFDITYQGYDLKDTYQEGSYFSVNAAEGKTLLVMKFSIANPGKKAVEYDTSTCENTFYGVFDNKNKVTEKRTFSNMELSSGTRTINAGKKVDAVMIFEISKEQASAITSETLLVEIDGKIHQIKM